MSESASQCGDIMFVSPDVVTRVEEAMPEEHALLALSDLFKTFGDSTRIRILFCMLSSEMCVGDIASILRMSQSAISHQLAVLKRQKLIKARRDGKAVFYSLADDHVRTIIQQGMNHVNE